MKYLLVVIMIGFLVSCGNQSTPPKPDPKKDFIIESKSIKIEGSLTDKAKFDIEVPKHELGIAVDLLDNK